MTNATFSDLGLSQAILDALSAKGFEEPTEIQRLTIPLLLDGTQDIIAQAQTGTGKTAGFTLPMIDMLARGRAKARMPRSLILEPTRELAAQVSEKVLNLPELGPYEVALDVQVMP